MRNDCNYAITDVLNDAEKLTVLPDYPEKNKIDIYEWFSMLITGVTD